MCEKVVKHDTSMEISYCFPSTTGRLIYVLEQRQRGAGHVPFVVVRTGSAAVGPRFSDGNNDAARGPFITTTSRNVNGNAPTDD